MAKVITFSTSFPAYHPKKGEPTHFESKIKYSFSNPFATHIPMLRIGQEENRTIKFHTIRAGKRFKGGEYFSPRIWSSKPYNSKQIIIAPDIKIQKIWNIEIKIDLIKAIIPVKKDIYATLISINGKPFFDHEKLAQNDGLSLSDFLNWFLLSPDFKKNKTFTGQIICWNNNITY